MNLNSTTISIIKRLLGGRNNKPLKAILKRVEVRDLSRLFTILNDRETRLFVDALMSIDRASQALAELPPPQLVEVLKRVESPKLLTLLSFCPEEDGVYILSQLESERIEESLSRLEPARQARLRQLLSYPTGSAGRDMQPDAFALPMSFTAQEAIEKIRTRAEDESVYYIYCVNENQVLMGVVSLRELVRAQASTPLFEIMKKDVISVRPEATSDDVAELVGHYDYIALPVTNENGQLVGLVTVDNVLDLLQEKATATVYASAGLQEDDRVFSPASLSIRNRMPWMFVNLATAGTASLVVSLFENTISQLIVLASLNNIVSGMGGNSAIQTLTVITRGLATGDFGFITYKKAVIKELIVSLTIGLIAGIVAGLLVYLWKKQAMVALVLSLAMIVNSFVAALFGSLVPITLKKLKLDPASGSGVIATFGTDVLGFLSFLGIASLALKYFT